MTVQTSELLSNEPKKKKKKKKKHQKSILNFKLTLSSDEGRVKAVVDTSVRGRVVNRKLVGTTGGADESVGFIQLLF